MLCPPPKGFPTFSVLKMAALPTLLYCLFFVEVLQYSLMTEKYVPENFVVRYECGSFVDTAMCPVKAHYIHCNQRAHAYAILSL